MLSTIAPSTRSACTSLEHNQTILQISFSNSQLSLCQHVIFVFQATKYAMASNSNPNQNHHQRDHSSARRLSSSRATDLTRLPHILKTFTLEQAQNHWIYSEGEEKMEVDGTLYAIRDEFRHGYNRISFFLSPIPSETRDNESHWDIDQNEGNRNKLCLGKRLLKSIRARFLRLIRRARN